MSIVTVTDRLAAIEKEITGVTNAYGLSEIPGSLQSIDCPTCINIPGEAVFEILAADLVRSTRTYIMELYITPADTPLAFAKKMGLAEVFPARFATAFLARRTLESLSGVEDAQYIRDGGIGVMSYFDVGAWVVMQSFIEVTELETVTHADY